MGAVRWPLFLFFTDIILAVALSSWLAVYHHLWNDPATRGSLLMLTDILLASPTRESTALIIVFSPLLLSSGALYLNLSFLTLTTCRRLRGRSIITFGGVKMFFSMLRNLFSLNPFYIFFIRFYLIFYSFLSTLCSPSWTRAFVPILELLCSSSGARHRKKMQIEKYIHLKCWGL